MRNINGASSIELVVLLMFILMFVFIIRRFSFDGQDSHKLSVDLQKRTEKMMVEKDRPVCLEKISDKKFITDENGRQKKSLIYVTKNICGSENDGEYN